MKKLLNRLKRLFTFTKNKPFGAVPRSGLVHTTYPKVAEHLRGIVYNIGYDISFTSYMEKDNIKANIPLSIDGKMFIPVVHSNLEAIEHCIVRYAQSLPFGDLETMHKCSIIIDGTKFEEE